MISFYVGCVVLAGPLSSSAQSFSDNFNANVPDETRWAADVTEGSGLLRDVSQRLEYRVGSPDPNYDFAGRPLLGGAPMNADWEMVVTVSNNLTSFGEEVSAGIYLRDSANPDEELFIELYGGGFLTSLESEDFFFDADSGDIGVSDAQIKMSFNAIQQLVTTSYDRDGAGNAHGWTTFGTFGLSGSGGSTGNRDWNLTPERGFTVMIGAYSESVPVAEGDVWLDDFSLTIQEPEVPDRSIRSLVGDMDQNPPPNPDGHGIIHEENDPEGFDLRQVGGTVTWIHDLSSLLNGQSIATATLKIAVVGLIDQNSGSIDNRLFVNGLEIPAAFDNSTDGWRLYEFTLNPQVIANGVVVVELRADPSEGWGGPDYSELIVTTEEPVPMLSIRREGENIEVSWTGGGLLEATPMLVGPASNWEQVDDQTPFTTRADQEVQFYRVRR